MPVKDEMHLALSDTVAIPAAQAIRELCAMADLINAMQAEIGKHLRKHSSNALESSGRSFGLLTRLAGMIEEVSGHVDLPAADTELAPLYRYMCRDEHEWLFLPERTFCPFCGNEGARGEVWDGTWPAKEG